MSETSGAALITITHDVNVAALVGSFSAPWPIRQPMPTTRSSRPGFLPSMAKKLTTRLSSGLVAAAATIVGALAGLLPAIVAVRFTVIDAIRY